MTRATYIDYLTSYCKEQGISEGCYFNTFTAPHLQQNQQEQKNYLINKVDQLDEVIGVFEYCQQGNSKGWHVHTITKQPQEQANDTRAIYYLNGLIEYISKQAFKIQERIIYKRSTPHQPTLLDEVSNFAFIYLFIRNKFEALKTTAGASKIKKEKYQFAELHPPAGASEKTYIDDT